MSRREPLAPATVAQIVLALLLAGAAIALINGVRRSTPATSQVLAVPGLEADITPTVECRRTPSSTVQTGVAPILERPADGRRVSSNAVVACPTDYDGTIVTYTGEIVGDVLRRNDGAWVLMNDDAYALTSGPLHVSAAHSGTNSGLAVWLPEGVLAELERHADLQPGNSRWRGDVLEITGLLLRADPDDGGGLTIRTGQAEIFAAAIELEDPVNVPQAVAAGILLLAALATVTFDRIREQRR